ncbi:Phosphoglucomutase-3, partial [Blyttiomyces sp. JEL0837]
NPATRQEIQSLIDANDIPELERRLRNPIKFGTAGLRAAMEAGFAGMNQLTVIQASQGLASYIADVVPDAKTRGVVIGHDHRHNSEIFARLTAGVFLAAGFRVYLYRGLVHTPMVPFGVRHLKAAGGVMITASHNPKQDNGYKVYWENGTQIISPHDTGIAKRIQQNQTPQTWDPTLCDSNPNSIDQTTTLIDSYFEKMSSLIYHKEGNRNTTLKYVYTAMHGVGLPFVRKALELFDLPPAVIVSKQSLPDPNFPTVKFPNPEEVGALNEAMRVAESQGIGLVLANDPDADRFAVAERQADGKWYIFKGDEIGILLGSQIFRNAVEDGVDVSKKLVLVNTAVSSRMLKSFAVQEGCRYEETLTGFKWMGNKCVDVAKEFHERFGYSEAESLRWCFAYEEAIGFMVHGESVLDKDGVSALVKFLELAVRCDAMGRRVFDELESLFEKYGFHGSLNSYFVCRDTARIKKIFEKIRYGGGDGSGESKFPRTAFKREIDGKTLRYPTEIAGQSVKYIRDLTIGFEVKDVDSQVAVARHKPGNGEIVVKSGECVPNLPLSPEMITFHLEGDVTITLRTSGTEPKIKYYIEKKGIKREVVEVQLEEVVKAVGEDLLESFENNLESA